MLYSITASLPPLGEAYVEPTCAPTTTTMIQAAPKASTTTFVPADCAGIVRRVLDLKLAPEPECSSCLHTMSPYSAVGIFAGAFVLGFVLGLQFRRAAEDRALKERSERKRKTEWIKKTDNCIQLSTVVKEETRTVWAEK